MWILVVKLMLTYTLLSAIIVLCGSSIGLNSQNEQDRLALLAFKAEVTHDPQNVLSSWNESIHFCKWYGVTCSLRHPERVSMLVLQYQNLTGRSLSPYIGNLTFLSELKLQHNNFSHQIPPEIGRLRRLQVLFLHNNSFTGPIPYNLSYCVSLTILDLAYNQLVGKILSEIGSLTKLQMLILQRNSLTGEIPPSLGNLSSLQVLAISSNYLEGSFPSSLGQSTQIFFLSFGYNNLSGTIPPSIYNLSALDTFSADGNQIEGNLPFDLGNTLPSLKLFSIGGNQFTGSIPLSVSNATSLEYIDVAENNLIGQVPTLQNLHKLSVLVIATNQLGSGKQGDLQFISDLSNATELRWLMFGFNHFGGTMPTSISNLSTQLEQLSFPDNQLSGSIPDGIGNLVNLVSLVMVNNLLTGNIPNSIGKLSTVADLEFFDNELSGSIPSSLGNLTNLIMLGMQGNNLEGSIPASLGKCQGLQMLNLSYNNLSGEIPEEVIGLPSLSVYLDLSHNHFTGSLPLKDGKLKTLSLLDISDNMLSGEIPSSLGGCESLEVLHLQGNFFNGSIPLSMSSLRGIQDIDLSRNKLSGEIPNFLEGFGGLKNLNLSFNDFWGAVPTEGVFQNASAISIVGNTRLCGGISDLQLPKCDSEESQRQGASHRLKFIVPIVSFLALLGIAMVLCYNFLHFSRKNKKEISYTLGNSVLQVSYATLRKATDELSPDNLIGAGSFGFVYKGVLDSDDGSQQVAVKVFNLSRHGASKSFLAECEALRNIRHRNLVKIITACSSVDFQGNDFKALVYEFMENGNLEEWLHPSSGTENIRDTTKNLNLLQRLDISIDVASALDYLHNDCETPIVHCDLKPSNVLLNNEFVGHVSDFGLARFLSTLTSSMPRDHNASSIGVRGTVGYVAPEYGMGSEVSTNGDVYSFGILLMEMFTGKKPTDDMFSGDLSLRKWVEMAFPDRVTQVADSLLRVDRDEASTSSNPNQYNVSSEKVVECLNLVFRIGMECSVEAPNDRRNISGIAAELQSIRKILVQ